MLVDRRRRLTAVAVGVALLGASLAGCGQKAEAADEVDKAPRKAVDKERPAKPSYADVEALPEKLDADGTTIIVGDPDAPATVRLFEDLRCPVCEEFEVTGGGPELRSMTLQRVVKTEYTLASFLDDRLGGSGSKKAANALRAALERGKFAEYHTVLYANQPEEVVDGFTDEYLLELADKVEGLRSPAFDSAVKTMRYGPFVTASQRAYVASGAPGTPTMLINGQQLPEPVRGALFDKAMFSIIMKIVRDQSQT